MQAYEIPIESEESQDSWVVAYADLMTLLFILFALIVSVSQISRAKSEMLNQSFNKNTPSSLADLKIKLDHEITSSGLASDIQTGFTNDGLQIQFSERLIFGSGATEVGTEGANTLARLSQILKKMTDRFNLAVEGHTDNLPIKTSQFESNWSLSALRAATVVHELIQNGVDKDHITIHAFADTKPIAYTAPNGSSVKEGKEWRAINRRVTILVY